MVISPLLLERLFNARTGLGEEPGALFSHINAIFQPDAKFAIDGDHGFIAETHPWL